MIVVWTVLIDITRVAPRGSVVRPIMSKFVAWKGRKAPFGISRSLDVRDETKVGRKVLRLKVAVDGLSNYGIKHVLWAARGG
jgi:hypothetical protein